jgi:hypothetical protein
MANVPISPDCAEGKHANCVGFAFDLDEPELVVDCLCPDCMIPLR